MTREEQLDWLCRLRSEVKIYMPIEWVDHFEDALTESINALSQEPTVTSTDESGVMHYPQVEGFTPTVVSQEQCDKCEVGNPCLYCKHDFEKKTEQEPQCTEHPCLGTLCRYYKEPCDDAISREAVLEIICRETEWYDIRTQIYELPSVTQKSGKWIPVSERLPEDEQEILFSTKTGRVHSGKYHDDDSANQWYSHRDKCRAWNNVVTAWMPLPKPYEPQERSDKE